MGHDSALPLWQRIKTAECKQTLNALKADIQTSIFNQRRSIMEHVKPIKWSSLCRVCMKSTPEHLLRNINEAHSEDQPSLREKLAVLCPPVFSEQQLAKDSAMPPVVCTDCEQRILAAYELFQICLETNQELRRLLDSQSKVGIKTEVLMTVEPASMGMKIAHGSIEERELDVTEEKSQLMDTVEKTKRDQTCEICYKTMRTAKALEKHVRAAHPTEVRRCEICEKCFHGEEQLANHLKHHATGLTYQCELCSKEFKSSQALRYHALTHSGNTPFLCTVCGKAFNNRSNLRQHVVRHSDQKRFGCEQCPCRFHSKGALKAHMATHTKEQPFACDECGARFTMSYSLTKHMRIHKGIRPYSCDVCDMRFTNSSHAKRHMRTHTGEKPFSCSLCERSFTQSNDLVKHSRTHFGDKLYQCDRCELSYRLMTDLREHYKVHFEAGGDGDGKEMRFTSINMIQRRYEQQEQQQPGDLRPAEGAKDESVRTAERVVVIPVELADIPAVNAEELHVLTKL